MDFVRSLGAGISRIGIFQASYMGLYFLWLSAIYSMLLWPSKFYALYEFLKRSVHIRKVAVSLNDLLWISLI